jgi:hypothetical protein
MKKLTVLPVLLAAAFLLSAAGPSRVTRDALTAGEKSLDDRLRQQWNDMGLIGATRGVYLEGYGAVFTAEVSLVTAPISMMGPSITQKQLDQIKATKLERLPKLKSTLKQQLFAMASSMDAVPADENVTIALLLLRYPGEEKLPMQIVVQAPRKKLLEAGSAGVDSVIRVTEY